MMSIVNKSLAGLILGLVLLTLVACAPQAAPSPGAGPTQAPETSETPQAEPDAAQEARAWLASQLGLPPEQVEIVSTKRQEWQDSCLGLGGPAESCLLAVTPGWQIMLTAEGQTYEVRTDELLSVFRSPQFPAQPEALDPLAGTVWALASYGEPGAESPVITGPQLNLAFETGGQVGGFSGCNSFGGQYEVEGQSLSFSEINSTLVACAEEDLMAQELQYLQALLIAERFEQDGDQLKIWYDGGNGVLNFNRSAE
jgi:heat shock protein HslJ